jgi:hypothetical protein
MILKEEDPDAEFYVDDEDQMATFIEENDLDELNMILTGAYQSGYEVGAYQLASKNLIYALDDGGYGNFRVKFDKDKVNDPESMVEVYLPMRAAISTVEDGETIDDLGEDFSITVDQDDYTDNFDRKAMNKYVQDELAPKEEEEPKSEPQAVTSAAEHYGPVYHGGTFDAGEQKYHPAGKVLYTTRDKDAAQTYVQMHEERFGPGAELKSLYSRATHPASWNLVSKAAKSVGIDPEEGTPASVFDSEMHGEDKVIKLVKLLLDKGYDSANLPDIPYGGRGSEIEAHILLNKNLVSPATPKTGSEELDARYTRWFERKGWDLLEEEQHSAQYSWKTWGSPESIRGGCRYKVRVTCDETREGSPVRWMFLDKTDPNNHDIVRGDEYSALLVVIHENDPRIASGKQAAASEDIEENFKAYLAPFSRFLKKRGFDQTDFIRKSVFDTPYSPERNVYDKAGIDVVMVYDDEGYGGKYEWKIWMRPSSGNGMCTGKTFSEFVVQMDALLNAETKTSAAEEVAENDSSITKIVSYLTRKGFIPQVATETHYQDYRLVETEFDPPPDNEELNKVLAAVMVRRRFPNGQEVLVELADWYLNIRPMGARNALIERPAKAGDGLGSLIVALNMLTDPENQKSMTRYAAEERADNEDAAVKIETYLKKKGFIATDQQPHTFDDFKLVDTIYSPYSLEVGERYGWNLKWVRVRRRFMGQTTFITDLVKDWSLALNSSSGQHVRNLISPPEMTTGDGVGSLILALNAFSDPENRKSKTSGVLLEGEDQPKTSAIQRSLADKIAAFLTKKGLSFERSTDELSYEEHRGEATRFYLNQYIHDFAYIRVWGWYVGDDEVVDMQTGELLEPPQWAIVNTRPWKSDNLTGTSYAEFVVEFEELLDRPAPADDEDEYDESEDEAAYE